MSTDKYEEQSAKKSGSAKRKGAVLELERLKKREKELHVMKLSQEWDARRQKRRMDRQKWLQQRRDQNLPIWQRVGNLRVQATDETKVHKTTEAVLHDEIKTTSVVSANETKLQENCTSLDCEENQRDTEDERESCSEREGEIHADDPCTGENGTVHKLQAVNQDYQSVVVKVERRDSSEFCKSNDIRSPSPVSNTEEQGTEKKNSYQSKEWNHYQTSPTEGKQEPTVGAYQQLVTMVNSHPKTYGETTNALEISERPRLYQNAEERYRQQSELYRRHSEIDQRARQVADRARHLYNTNGRSRTPAEYPMDSRQHYEIDERSRTSSGSQSLNTDDRSHTSVIVQAMRQSGIAHACTHSEPTLLLASEPVRFEDVIREGGTMIQRLETSTAGIIGKIKTQDQDNVQDTRSSSCTPEMCMETNNQTGEQRRNIPPVHAQPDRSFTYTTQQDGSPDDVTRRTPTPTSTVSMATPVTNTTERPPVTYSVPNTSTSTPPGFLVPIFKPSVGEVVYAFVPSTGTGSGDSKPRVLPEIPAGSYLYPGAMSTFAAPGMVDYPRVLNPSATIHHGRHAPIPRAELAKRTAEAARFVDYARVTHSPIRHVGYQSPTNHLSEEQSRDTGYPTHDREYSPRDMGLAFRDMEPSLRDTGSPLRDTRSPKRDTRTYLRETDSPPRDMSSFSRDTSSFSRDAESPSNRYSDGEESYNSHSSTAHAQVAMATDDRHTAPQTSPELAHAQSGKPKESLSNGFGRADHNNAGGVNGQPTHSTSSSPFSVTSSEAIINPTAIYVRPKLVPREILAPSHYGTSGGVPTVEYIKTDSICNKQLDGWTARDVAQFVAATDCSDSAGVFLDQDIDGKAVLLLSQEIFVNKLSLKLGTAMKLYNHIANLRTAMLL